MLEQEEAFLAAFGLLFRTVFILFLTLSSALPCKEKLEILLAPYLLPEDHPVKHKLDKIFSKNSVLLNLKTLRNAGFLKAKPRPFTELIVTKHKKIPGYIFKLYLDCQRYNHQKPEYQLWIQRIKGANKVRKTIAELGFDREFKVPKKWIYILSKTPCCEIGYYKKQTILVVEDMQLLTKENNDKKWGSDQVSQGLLDHLYLILKKTGLSDGAKPDNIPFSVDGKIAFIDTQSHHEKVKYHRLVKWLSKENKEWWRNLIEKK
jgi:hypothetical protein